jgi:Core-2/I-Branching enzyme
MAVQIGFVLVTHNKPRQAIRLVSRLNSMFEQPPIAWHHDFTFCDLPLDSVTNNISLVLPHLRTGWAKFSIVEAMLGALEMLVSSPNPPDWFVLLSGADYPIKSADKIVYDLSTSQFDAHLKHERICFNNYERYWQRLCYDRYCSVKFQLPFVSKRLLPTTRTITLRYPVFTRLFTPFSRYFSCFAGEYWFCANRSAAEYLLKFHRTMPALANYYRMRDDADIVFPDESYHHTILCNSHFRISQNNWRYVDWPKETEVDHPKILLMEDLTKLCDSTAHFARKFDDDVDGKILDALDELILG